MSSSEDDTQLFQSNGKRSSTTVDILSPKKTLGVFNKWSKMHYEVGEKLYLFKNSTEPKPTEVIRLTGAFIRFMRNAESQASYKKKYVLEIQIPTGFWRVSCGSYEEYMTLGDSLKTIAHKFNTEKQKLVVDSKLDRNFVKESKFSSLFDAVFKFLFLTFFLACTRYRWSNH
jgi:hypothetical protein